MSLYLSILVLCGVQEADIKIPNIYSSGRFALISAIPKNKMENGKGRVIWNMFFNTWWNSAQKVLITGHSQNTCQWLASRDPHCLQRLASPPAKCAFCFGVIKKRIKDFHPNSHCAFPLEFTRLASPRSKRPL